MIEISLKNDLNALLNLQFLPHDNNHYVLVKKQCIQSCLTLLYFT